MDGYTLYISRCSGGDGVEESFKAKIKRREDALDAFAVAEAYCKGIGMVSRCEREGFDGFIIDLCSDAEDETRELETYGAILIGCGIMAYTLMLASVDAPVWATIEFVMGTLFMVVGVWCVYLAGMEYDYQMEKRRYRNKR